MSPHLDLSGADTSLPEFDPIPSGSYEAAVYEAEWTETQGGPNSKLPAGTPRLSVTWVVIDEADDGKWAKRRVWDSYIIPPAKIGSKVYENKAKMDGIFVRFLEAIGYDKDEVMKEGFELDLEDVTGREATIVLGQEKYTSRDLDDDGEPIVKTKNVVKGVKKAGLAAGGGKKSALI
jgi:hypothetical protein